MPAPSLWRNLFPEKKNHAISKRPNRRGLLLEKLEDRTVPAVQRLPDLHVLESYLPGWSIDRESQPGRTLLRFSTAMANAGPGAFEIRGTSNIVTGADGTEEQIVNQRIYRDDGTFTDREAGTFIYHPTHGHIHFEDFAQGYVRVRGAGNSVGASVATGLKTSFCLIDINRYDPAAPNSPAQPVYQTCGSIFQGISPGWNDVYSSGLDGQFIDITGVPNGNYWLEVVADPANHILEGNENNNVTRIPIVLNGGQQPAHFRITHSTPLGATDGPVSSIEVTFNQTVNASTFTKADVKMTGPSGSVVVSSVTRITDTVYRIAFPNQGKVGTYTLNIGPNLKSSSGESFDQNNNGTGGELADIYDHIFAIEPPRVHEVIPSGNVAGPIQQVVFEFPVSMNPATFTAAQVIRFTGPQGNISVTNVSAVVGSNNKQFRVSFTPQNVAGVYTMTLAGTIADSFGNRVDHNANAIGGETPGDQFTTSFTLNTAGSDTFGYSATATTPSPTSIVSTGEVVVPVGDDLFAPVAVGSNSFNFYGVNYSANQIFVSTNGLITFGVGSDAYDNSDLSPSSPPTIAVLWDDWTVGTTPPMILSRLLDDNADNIFDRLILEWNNLQHVPTSPSTVSFQAILQLNTGDLPGSIMLNYLDLETGDATAEGKTATVGIKADGAQGARRLLISQNDSSSYVGTGKAILIESPAKVLSVTPAGPESTNASSATYDVVFNRSVAGVDSSDFQIVGQGVTGAQVTSVTGSGSSYKVTFTTGTGDGHLLLNVIDNDSITDANGGKLGGLGLGNGNFANGVALNVDRTVPTVTAIQALTSTPAVGSVIKFRVAFSEQVTGVDLSDFSLTNVGMSGALILSVTGTGSLYEVLVNSGLGVGSLRLNVVDNDSIHDGAGNKLGGTGINNGLYLAGPVIAVQRSTSGMLPPILSVGNANNSGKAKAVLQWNPIAGATYTIRRSTKPTGFSPVTLATGLNAVQFIDSTAVFGTTYYYTVVATVGPITLVSNQAVITPTFRAFIHFSKPTGSLVPGFGRDLGYVFGPRANSLSYGWSQYLGQNNVDRNSTRSPSELHDSFVFTSFGNWQIAVPNGRYQVRVLAGDPLANSGNIGWKAEGTTIVEGNLSATRHWLDGSAFVAVSDGRLTLTPISSTSPFNKINAVEIEMVPSGVVSTDSKKDLTTATIRISSPAKPIAFDLDGILTGKLKRYFVLLDPVGKTLRLYGSDRRFNPIGTRSIASLPFSLTPGKTISVTLQVLDGILSVNLFDPATSRSKAFTFLLGN